MWSRRAFIKSGALAAFASTIGGVPNFLVRSAIAGSKSNLGIGKRKTLVCIFQRGAMDGIQAVQPLNDPHLAGLRPDLVNPSTGDNKMVELNEQFGLHPLLEPLFPFYKEGRLAIVHGIGSPNTSRSHFDAQDYMETGTPGKKGTASGWLNRAIGLLGHESTPFQSVSMTASTPRSMYGPAYSLTVENLDNLKVAGGNEASTTNQGFEAMYRQTTQEILQTSGSVSLDAIQILEEAKVKSLQPMAGANYPNSSLGFSLKQIAQLIKGGVGLEIAFAESHGWDSHARQLAPFAGFNNNARDLSRCIAAFWKDVEAFHDDVALMTMTEFGRTIHQNGSLGTDHGRASCMFVLGNEIDGGNVYGNVPELAVENLEEGRDLPVTTDFRSLFGAVVKKHLGIEDIPALFPGWDGELINI